MVKSITFVCAYNKTRSQIAEFLFNKYNKNKNWKAISAGVFGGKYAKDEILAVVLKKYGARIGRPKTLDRHLLREQNMIILVADDIPKSLFDTFKKSNGTKVIQWNVKDGWARKTGNRVERFEEVYLEIDKRIRKFVEKLD